MVVFCDSSKAPDGAPRDVELDSDCEEIPESSGCAYCDAPDSAPCEWSMYDCNESNNRKSPVSVCGKCAAWECVSCHTRFCKACYENMRNTDSTHDYTDRCYGC